ncbi:MAG: Gfo/Idh/MocA family oxidoreductase [Rikenellaceae bacterium]|nr:Gfo/Idh/MocA family oxidoreductase [Rikenellaceae bacterium]
MDKINRRKFLHLAGIGVAAAATTPYIGSAMPAGLTNEGTANPGRKTRIAIVGTGSRGTYFSRSLVRDHADQAEIVGLCDINPGRVEASKQLVGLNCPTYTDLEQMLGETKPDYLLVTTMDSTHDQVIVQALELGYNVITEKPMTTDEVKCQRIIDAEKRTGKKVIVAFNYRYANHRTKIWELLRNGEIGDITSVDFHWYLNTSHGADYFRRWHRRREFGGSLWLHKATHHFDLLNWWLDTEPEEVFAYGELEFYGKNGPFRAENCRSCTHTRECSFYFDLARSENNRKLYIENEHHDGYLRDGCVFKEDIDIFDKMCASIKYANGVQASYSLTTYSPYEGYRIAFNGTKGRIDAWVQESHPTHRADYEEIMLMRNFGDREYIRVIDGTGGHAGGDKKMLDMILTNSDDPLKQRAGVRDGAMSILTGVAARKSCDSGQPVKIASLTEFVPKAKKE